MIYDAFLAGFLFNLGLRFLLEQEYGLAIASFSLVFIMLCNAIRRKEIFSIEKQIEIMQECLEKNAEDKSENKQ